MFSVLRTLGFSGRTEFIIRDQGMNRGRAARKGAGPSVRGMGGVGSVVETQGGDAGGGGQSMNGAGKQPMVCWGVTEGPIARLRLEAAADEVGDWFLGQRCRRVKGLS